MRRPSQGRQAKAAFFSAPTDPAQRRYEALRAYFVEGLSACEAAERFAYASSTMVALVRDFAAEPSDFFVERRPGPRSAPAKEAARSEVVRLRRAGHSVTEIAVPVPADLVREVGRQLACYVVACGPARPRHESPEIEYVGRRARVLDCAEARRAGCDRCRTPVKTVAVTRNDCLPPLNAAPARTEVFSAEAAPHAEAVAQRARGGCAARRTRADAPP